MPKKSNPKVLIIGAAGFVGNHLILKILESTNWEVYATKMQHEKIETQGISVLDLDILSNDEIEHVLKNINPDYIFHLAAQSSVALSWKNPALTIDVNIKGSVNVLDAIRKLNLNSKILLIGSGEEYGFVGPNELPIDEKNHVRPGNIYAATKVAQNLIGKIYSDAYKMNIIMVRAFNHIGPDQAPQFVIADFCKQVAEIESGMKEPIIHVGNLQAKRDFTDVRDVVRAYILLIQNGLPGETYNVGQGISHSIEAVLKKIISFSKATIEVQIDPSRLRPLDIPIIEANIEKISADTGWKPEISLEKTLKDTLDYWRSKVN